jgi:hypothetical protein
MTLVMCESLLITGSYEADEVDGSGAAVLLVWNPSLRRGTGPGYP